MGGQEKRSQFATIRTNCHTMSSPLNRPCFLELVPASPGVRRVQGRTYAGHIVILCEPPVIASASAQLAGTSLMRLNADVHSVRDEQKAGADARTSTSSKTPLHPKLSVRQQTAHRPCRHFILRFRQLPPSRREER